MQRIVKRLCVGVLFVAALAFGALFGLPVLAVLNARWG